MWKIHNHWLEEHIVKCYHKYLLLLRQDFGSGYQRTLSSCFINPKLHYVDISPYKDYIHIMVFTVKKSSRAYFYLHRSNGNREEVISSIQEGIMLFVIINSSPEFFSSKHYFLTEVLRISITSIHLLCL